MDKLKKSIFYTIYNNITKNSNYLTKNDLDEVSILLYRKILKEIKKRNLR